MTDQHRVTDLAYGVLGEASYDGQEGEWLFSRQATGGAFALLIILASI
jgi:hypothetical protein